MYSFAIESGSAYDFGHGNQSKEAADVWEGNQVIFDKTDFISDCFVYSLWTCVWNQTNEKQRYVTEDQCRRSAAVLQTAANVSAAGSDYF